MSERRIRWSTFVEAGAIAVATGLWLVLATRAVRLGTPFATAWCLLASVCGYVVADFFSGMAHWFCDTFFEEDTPLVGPFLIQPFREHHRDPLAMTRHGFLERNGNSCIALVPGIALAVAVTPQEPLSVLGRSAVCFVMALFAGLAVTNQLHSWAHDPNPPAAVRWLQAHGWILSPAGHARHHRSPYAQAYCVTHGRLNAFLDATSFFTRATALGERLRLPRARHL